MEVQEDDEIVNQKNEYHTGILTTTTPTPMARVNEQTQ